MRRQLLLLLVLIAVLAIALLNYWPLLSSYFMEYGIKLPSVQRAPSVRPSVPAGKDDVRVDAAIQVAVDPPPEVESPGYALLRTGDLTDPFALRVAVKLKTLPKPDVPKLEVKTPVQQGPEPQLEGIWVDSGMRVAFISGQTLVEGGSVLGWRVSKISKTQVVLVKGGRSKILELEGQ